MTAITNPRLEADCWCGSKSMLVPVEWVSEGRTDSCSPGCYPGCPMHDTDEFDEVVEPIPTPTRKRRKMNRFRADQFDPEAESSPVSDTIREAYPRDLILIVGPGVCPCGCGEEPKGKKATFAMGHDIRLRGKLTRAAAAGVQVVQVMRGVDGLVSTDPIDPASFAAAYSTPKLDWAQAVADGAAKIIAKTPAPPTAAIERKITEAATGELPDGRTLESLGVWSFTGRVAAIYREADGTMFYDYVGRDGTRRFARGDDESVWEVAS